MGVTRQEAGKEEEEMEDAFRVGRAVHLVASYLEEESLEAWESPEEEAW